MTYYLEHLREEITRAVVDKLGTKEMYVRVENANPSFDADLAIPCFALARDLKKSPDKIAEILAHDLELSYALRVEAMGGYVNIWLNPDHLAKGVLKDIKKCANNKVAYGNNYDKGNQNVVIEYTDPNPFKEFHIGHVYSNSVGESIARLFTATGAKVHRVSYHGDVGLHIAKAMWGIQQLIGEEGLKLDNIEKSERAAFLGRAYARGARAYEDEASLRAEIQQLNKKIYEGSDPEIQLIYEKGLEWSFAYFDEMYDRLHVGFEKKYLESQTVEKARAVVDEGLKALIFKESDGAVIFRGEEYGLHTRVFINSMGLPTYEAKDLGLALLKHEDYDYDQSIIITGNEQTPYFKVILKALELIHPELSEATLHIGHGMVRLTSGKMSSRTGKVITGKEVLDEIEEAIENSYEDSPSVKENTLGALKFAFLKQNVGGDIQFDINESISLEGNSGPYVQYAAVRIKSILNKIDDIEALDLAAHNWEKEKELLIKVAQYPEVVRSAAFELAPHIIANYAFELAHALNRFYEHVNVINSEPLAKAARVSLLEAVEEVLEHALDLLGIEVPEKM